MNNITLALSVLALILLVRLTIDNSEEVKEPSAYITCLDTPYTKPVVDAYQVGSEYFVTEIDGSKVIVTGQCVISKLNDT